MLRKNKETIQNETEKPYLKGLTDWNTDRHVLSCYGDFPIKAVKQYMLWGKDFNYHDDYNGENRYTYATLSPDENHVENFFALPNLPGFAVATDEDCSHKHLFYVSLKNGQVSEHGAESDDDLKLYEISEVADSLKGNDKESIKNAAKSHAFETAVINMIINKAVLDSTYLDHVPYHIFQKAKDLNIDYETEVLEGFKQRFTDYILKNATPEMDCSNAARDAEAKVEHLRDTFINIQNKLQYLENFADINSKEDEQYDRTKSYRIH